MAAIPTKSQPCRQGSLSALLGFPTHTHTPQKESSSVAALLAQAVHLSKAPWIDVSQWGCCWHLELGDSLLYSNAPTL